MNKNKLIILIAFAASSILIATLMLSIATGFIAFTIKQPSQKITLHYDVCSEKIVDRYNAVMSSETDFEKKYTTFIKDVEAMSDHEKDSNCSYILLDHYLNYKPDAKKARKYFNSLADNASRGVYVSWLVNRFDNRPSLELSVKALEKYGTITNNEE